MLKVKVNSRNQIVIPAEARKKLGIKPGEELVLDVVAGALVLVPARDTNASALKGLGRDVWGPIDVDDWIDQERESWEP